MKRYGKSTVVHKTAKFDESLINGSTSSNEKNAAKKKLRESLSFRKKTNKDQNSDEGEKDGDFDVN